MAERPNLPIGTSDFRRIREEGKLYVDKTAWIGELIGDPALVLMFPRPRRFGKTTNLSMLRCFLEKRAEDLSPLFEGLDVWGDERARAHFQRYPVIYLSLKDAKANTFEDCLAAMQRLLADVYAQNHDLLHGLPSYERSLFTAVLQRKADAAALMGSLQELSRQLYERHGQRAWVLIDEYDTPLHEAYVHGYFDQAVAFFRGLLSGALKDNAYLQKGVLTGILRIAKESIFSDLNNVDVYSLTRPRYGAYFGFTEPEVEALARRANFAGSLDQLREWYNGYRFGERVIYNPWSVLSALNEGTCASYWVNTSSNGLIRELLLRATGDQYEELETLLQGGTFRKRITETTVLRGLHADPEALWSFLVFSGYLRVSEARQEEDGSTTAELGIPNRELRSLFSELFSEWLKAGLGGQRQVEEVGRALLSGDVEACEHALGRLLGESASTLDTATSRRAAPEQVYHAFVLGLLLYLQPRWLVRSNRESGYGRSDVLIVPREPGRPGVVLELKVKRRGQTTAKAIAEGLQQIADRDYAAELRAHGAAPIHALVAVFDGKHVVVRAGAATRRAGPKKSSKAARTGARPVKAAAGRRAT